MRSGCLRCRFRSWDRPRDRRRCRSSRGLFGEGKRSEFAQTVNQSVYRISAASLLATALMVPASLPLVDLAFRRGHFTFADSLSTSVYFAWFSLSLALWSAQALYARAFYAAGDTLTPMVASTLIVIASLPVYAAMFRHFDVAGLAMASDLGILLHTVVLAWLLSRKKLVALSGLPWRELMKALATAIFAGVLCYAVARRVVVHGNWRTDVQSLALIGLTWLVAIVLGLWMTRSRLWDELRRRKQPVASYRAGRGGGEDRRRSAAVSVAELRGSKEQIPRGLTPREE